MLYIGFGLDPSTSVLKRICCIHYGGYVGFDLDPNNNVIKRLFCLYYRGYLVLFGSK